jgi:hypothetical protein
MKNPRGIFVHFLLLLFFWGWNRAVTLWGGGGFWGWLLAFSPACCKLKGFHRSEYGFPLVRNAHCYKKADARTEGGVGGSALVDA